MMIAPAGASPYAAAAALDRQFRSEGAATDGDSATTAPDPDVVVTLSQGASAPSTYDASGKLAGTPAPDDDAANATDGSAETPVDEDSATAA